MAFSKTGLTGSVAGWRSLLAGCQGIGFASEDTTPEPLPPAPAGTVDGDQLPPPAAPGTRSSPPRRATPTSQRCRRLRPRRPPTAPDVTAAMSPASGTRPFPGQSCKVATPQTKFGAGFRAGPLRCPAPLDGVKSWNVAGKQLALYDADGGVLRAALFVRRRTIRRPDRRAACRSR